MPTAKACRRRCASEEPVAPARRSRCGWSRGRPDAGHRNPGTGALQTTPCGASQELKSHAGKGEERNPIGILANRTMSRHAAAVFPQSVRRSCLRVQGFARVPPGASTAPVYLPVARQLQEMKFSFSSLVL
ncbi:hypothetical protein U0070_012792, partial [Myodes glareolus]